MTNDHIAKDIINIFKENWINDFIIDTKNKKTYTYSDFFTFAYYGKIYLNEHQINDKVALIYDNSIELAVFYFAALLNGNIVIPIDPLKGFEEIKEIIEESKCESVITDDIKVKEYLCDIKILNLDENDKINIFKRENIEKKTLEIFKDVDFSTVYSITFTSGSTGKPKGVMHTFENFYLTSRAFSKQFGFNSRNTFYHNLPMTYMAGILNLIILPFLSQSKIIVAGRFNISRLMNFWDHPIELKANTFFFIPTILSMLLRIDRSSEGAEYTKNTNITACVATAPLNLKVKDKFEKKYGVNLYESYGLSETLFVSTNSPYNEKNEGVGKILEGAEIEFWEENEILIEVPWQFKGYYNVDSSDLFVNDKFCSGDMGEYENENYLFITGRKKDIIIRGGINISPKKIENVVLETDLFADFHIIGVKNNILGEKIVCCYVEKENFTKEVKADLNKKLMAVLGINYQVDEYFKVKNIPKNINGKVDKFELLKLYHNK